jgi:hypothetical protein
MLNHTGSTASLMGLALLIAACGPAQDSRSTADQGAELGTTAGAGGLSAVKNVFVILMENHNWSQIKGNASAPYINGTLLTMGAHAEKYVNLPGLHPSEPNYLWLEAGDNFGILNDNSPSLNHQSTTRHLTNQLEAAGITWKAYAEDISGSSCPVRGTGNYVPRHVPFVFFDDIINNSARCTSHVRPYSELASDLASGNVPRYVFITPNLCNDMHDACGGNSVGHGDTWLSKELPHIFASSAYTSGGVVLVTWDESERGDHPIGMIVLSPFAKPGYASNTSYSHSSTLRTVQTVFNVQPFLGGAAKASDLGDMFQ